MRATSRLLIAVFLSLLPPLQAGSALARSVAMASLHPVPVATAQPVMVKGNAPGPAQQVAHATGASHQHDAHAHHEHRQVKKNPPSGKDDGTHKSRHAKGQCNDCGKCCMSAAVAPPPALAASFQPGATRAAWLPYRARIAAHIPDGPERPPRSLTV